MRSREITDLYSIADTFGEEAAKKQRLLFTLGPQETADAHNKINIRKTNIFVHHLPLSILAFFLNRRKKKLSSLLKSFSFQHRRHRHSNETLSVNIECLLN